MTILSDSHVSGEPETAENIRPSTKKIGPRKAPAGPRDLAGNTPIPTVFLMGSEWKLGDLKVVGHFVRKDEVFRTGMNCESVEEISAGSGMSVRQVQHTITRLNRAGKMVCEPGLYKGSPVTFRYLRFDAGGPPPAAKAPRQAALFFAPPPQDIAPEPAHQVAPVKVPETRQENANVSEAPATGGGEPPAVEPAPPCEPADPPAPVKLDAATVERLAGVVRSRRRESERKMAFWALDDAGQLPADLVGTFEPRRKPEPEKPRRTPPPAAPAVAAAETVEAAIRALATPEADAKAHADRVADRVAESLREVAYRPFIKARARDAASGLIDPAKLARAFDVARRSTTAEKPGSILTKELRRLIGFDGRWQDLASHVASRNPAPTPPRLP